ncbi:hypothetical protein BD769DRAFT_1390413 [Suillus cothurnatus]|nr:hypothetical protein BD769DRAFT_1390413 [Suillus cothurnatus]
MHTALSFVSPPCACPCSDSGSCATGARESCKGVALLEIGGLVKGLMGTQLRKGVLCFAKKMCLWCSNHKANSHLAQPTTKCKADDVVVISESEPEDSGQPRAAARKPPHKIMWHMTDATSIDVPEVAISQGTSPVTLDHFLKPRSWIPYCKAPSQQPMDTGISTQCQLPTVTPSSTPPNPVAGTTALTPIPRPPGMTLSQQFFTIVTRIDARAMHISSDVEFHLFMDMRAEFAWISFKMMPKQWAAATETCQKSCAALGSKVWRFRSESL